MSEGTVFLVLTLRTPGVKIRRAELGFVLIRVIELFDAIVSPFTQVTFVTIAVLACDLRTNFGLVGPKGPPSIFVKIMVEGAALQIMILRILLTLINLECEEVEEHSRLRCAYLSSVIATTMDGTWATFIALVTPRLGLLMRLLHWLLLPHILHLLLV